MQHRSGFTLVELSIVLVIIGLITGGVLVGRNLIEAAKIRQELTQIERFKTAVHTFEAKYNGLPGDLNQTDAAAFGFTPRGGGRGHGDGDGILEYCDGTVSTSAYLGCESALFWRDLSDAGLIEESFTAATDAPIAVATGQANNTYVPDAKVGVQASVIAFSIAAPVSIPNDIGAYYNSCGVGSICYAIAGIYSNSIAAEGGAFAGVIGQGVGLTPLEAFAIDSKIDDGLPMTGNVQGGNYTSGGCDENGCSPNQILPSEEVPVNCVTWDTYPPTTILYATTNALNTRRPYE